jgi:hypothetical protein
MLSKAQEVSQAIGAEMRRAREAIIAEYGPGIFDSAAASGAVADLPTRALGLLAAAAAPAARNADELQLEHSSEVMEELIKAKGKLRQRDEALRERDLELAELRAQLEGLRLKAARAERKRQAASGSGQASGSASPTASGSASLAPSFSASATASAPASPSARVRPSGKLVPVHVDLVEHRLRVHLGEVGAPTLASLLLCDLAVAVYSR